MANKVILVGRVGKDPEIRTINESKLATFSFATSEKFKTKSGEKKEHTDWHNITVWGILAGIIETYVKKGDKLYIEGKVRYEKYEKDGQTRYSTKIIANSIEMLGSKSNDQKQPKKTEVPKRPDDISDGFEDVDDLPF